MAHVTFFYWFLAYYTSLIESVVPTTAPYVNVHSPSNGEILESSTLFVHIEVVNFITPLLGRKICIGLASKQPEWRHEVCLDELVNEGKMSIDNLLLGCEYTLRIILEDDGHTISTTMRFFSVGLVDVPVLPLMVDQKLIRSSRLVPADYARTGHPRAMSIEDALLLGTQLLWGSIEDIADTVEKHQIWIAPSSTNMHKGGTPQYSTDANEKWRMGDSNEYNNKGTIDESAKYAKAVYKAVLKIKPSHPDASHGIAIYHLQSGESGLCAMVLEDVLDDISMSKAAAVRAIEV